MLLSISLFLFLANPSFIITVLSHPPPPITILGSVYCDLCYDNTFSTHTYFLPGVDVNVECKIKARSPRTTEDISFSVNRTTNIHGMYTLNIPSVDGVDCMQGPTVQSFCRATLLGQSVSACSLPAKRISQTVISFRSKQTNACVYTLDALSFRPPERNATLCSDSVVSWNASKFFLPYFPPYVFPWPQLPPLPPLPQLPPLPPLPELPPLPHLPPLPQLPPFPSNPPSLPFPFPSIPPPAPPSPGINLGDPRSWIPQLPQPPPVAPPPPVFNFWDPNTWFPHSPPSSPPP